MGGIWMYDVKNTKNKLKKKFQKENEGGVREARLFPLSTPCLASAPTPPQLAQLLQAQEHPKTEEGGKEIGPPDARACTSQVLNKCCSID